MSEQVEKRVEYRVVSTGAIRHDDETTPPIHDQYEAEVYAEDMRRHYKHVVIQQRTVEEHPWENVADV